MSNNAVLFCIPYAGGSSMSISNVTRFINIEGLEIHCLELPGRGMRSNEPFVSSVGEAISDLCKNVEARLKNRQQSIIFWGHSLGALLALLISHQFQENNFNVAGLIVSGMKAPFFVEPSNTKSFKNQRTTLLSQILPIKNERNRNSLLFQRAQKKGLEIMEKDIAILEDSKMINWLEVIIKQPLTVIIGEQDELFPTIDYYVDWQLHSSDKTDYYSTQGGHLFVIQHPEKSASILMRIISTILN
jgi:surfactin synthase thioesterase subunit